MGDPIKLAKEANACAIPSRAPKTFGSGQTTGNILGGSGIKAPLKHPYNAEMAMNDPVVCAPIHAIHTVPLVMTQNSHGVKPPIRVAV